MSQNSPRYRRFGQQTASLLRRRVAEAKGQGYAVTESFYRPGVGAMGMMVPGDSTRPDLAISIITSVGRLNTTELLAPELCSAASEVFAVFSVQRTSV
jgi:DNA-binding IclR family transcriptional regulator